MRRDRQVTEAEERMALEAGEAADREWLRRSLRKSRIIMWSALAFWAAVLAALAFSGCASVQTPQGKAIVIDEPPNGCVAKALDRANISAITPPWLPPIIFDGREDKCRVEHEFEHKRQQKAMGEVAWTEDYVDQFMSCVWRADLTIMGEAIHRCYLGITWEVMARAVQDACAEREAR